MLCLFLVIFGHTQYDDSFLNVYLSSFRMPLFFLLSGYNRKSGVFSWERMRRDASRLLIPYIGFWVLLYPWWLLALTPRHPELYPIDSLSDALLKPFIGLLLGLGHNTSVSYSISAPLWFLAALFALRTLYDILARLTDESMRWLALSAAVLPLAALTLHRAGIVLPFSIASAFVAAPFYCVGIVVRSGRCRFLTESIKRRPGASALLLFGALVPLAWLNGRIDLASMHTGRSLLLFYPAALVGGVGIISIGLALRNQTFPLLRLFSTESLSIMALHLVFIALGKLVLLFLLPEADVNTLPSSLFLALFAIASSLPAVFALDQFAPWLTGRRRGSAADVLRSASMPSLLDPSPLVRPRRLSTGNSDPS